MIIFQNPGMIDLDAALMMGASVKEGDSPIGYFGTGLKFAIATILRQERGRIWINHGNRRTAFIASPQRLRGKEFNVVYRIDRIDGVQQEPQVLGFTTELGRNWEPWMAFRELGTNALDEGGGYELHGDDSDLSIAGETIIHVKGIDDVWHNRRSIILEGKPLISSQNVHIHEGSSIYAFYRGVRIFRSSKPFAYTYNIQSPIELTEDRTAKHPFQLSLAIERAIGALEDQRLLRRMLTVGEGFFEHDLDVPAYGSPGDAFNEAARKLANEGGGANANPKAIAHARRSALEDMQEGGDMKLDDLQAKMLDRAFMGLAAIGVDREKYPLQLCESLGPQIHGLAKDGRLYLSRLAFEKGTRELAATIFEEWAHLESGKSDETRGFQNYLIDRIMLACERMSGELF